MCNNLDIDVSGEKLLKNITFKLEPGEKAGLVGVNGSGKTTLLKAVIGEIPYGKGEIFCNASIGYLPQTPVKNVQQGSVFEIMLAEKKDILKLRTDLRYLEIKMSEQADERVFEQYSTLTEKYERSGGYALEAQIRKILSGLGLSEDYSKDLTVLSGGQKTRLALAKLLLRAPELLILDEPTNHLDIEALEWLEGYLGSYKGALIVVSHDRYFLDRIVNKILFIRDGKLKEYKGNFSEFELQRALEEKTAAREAEKINRKIASLEEYIRRYKAGIKAKQARGRERQLKKIQPVNVPSSKKPVSISFENSLRSGHKVLEINNLSVSFNWKKVFENVNLELRRGDKVALLGKNGVGKTTLLKAVLGRVPYEGQVSLGANVKIGYYSQEHEDVGLRGTVIDEIRYSSSLEDPQIRSILARFGFCGEDVFKPLSVLSGGEKSRIALCKLFLARGNLLLLDEPTNHLDVETREILEEALMDYDGTVLLVSHDRYFLDKVVNKVAFLTPKGLKIFEGDYTSYRDKIQKENEETASSGSNKFVKLAKIYQEESKRIRRQERLIKQLEDEIMEKELKLKEIEAKMEEAANNYEAVLSLHEEYEKVRDELDKLMENWLEHVD